MLFNSQEYVLLLVPFAILYWLVPWQRARLVVMLAGSVAFYASWDWRFLPLLYGAVIVSYALVSIGATRRAMARRTGAALFGLTIGLNLLLLGIFKYTNFLLSGAVDTGAAILRITDASFTPLSIILPLGISFFTFQLIAYAVDVERGVVQKERSLLTFSVFISYFPQLIAGPICRGRELLPQLNARQTFSVNALIQGILMLCVGYFIKAGIADNLAPYVQAVYSDASAATHQETVYATLAFALQIFFDFWGYSTMALGSAWMFGIMLPVNFNLPYIATSFQTFWRRWHMTLSFWLRDYLYISLGGNRHGRFRTYINLFLVMLIGGLWHGAAWTFVVWGAIHGAALVIERLVVRSTRLVVPEGGRLRPAWLGPFVLAPAGWAITIFVTLIAWIFFRADSLSDAVHLTSLFLQATVDPSLWLDEPVSQQLSYATRFMLIGVIFMGPLHLLNLMGNNQNFYRGDSVWSAHIDTNGSAPEAGIAVRPVNFLLLSGRSVVFPPSLKLIVSFWLFAIAYALSAELTVPFIYFQF